MFHFHCVLNAMPSLSSTIYPRTKVSVQNWYNFVLLSDTTEFDFEVAEFKVDNRTSDVVVDLSSDQEMNISLSVRSTTSRWPVMQNNESLFDVAFYIAGKSV